MIDLILQRVTRRPDVTMGVWLDADGIPFAVSLEEPDKQNQRGVSCIPAGTYAAKRIMSPKRKTEVYQLENVPGRSAIQIHSGNTVDDISGCCLVGTGYGRINGKPSVMGSMMAFREFMQRFTAPTITVSVRDLPSTE